LEIKKHWKEIRREVCREIFRGFGRFGTEGICANSN